MTATLRTPVTGEFVGSDERGTSANSRTMTTVTVVDTATLQRQLWKHRFTGSPRVAARCVLKKSLIARTCLVRPSLQITKASPGSTDPVTTSSSRSSATPTARVITLLGQFLATFARQRPGRDQFLDFVWSRDSCLIAPPLIR